MEKAVIVNGRVVGTAVSRAFAYFRALAVQPGRRRRVAILETERGYYCRVIEDPPSYSRSDQSLFGRTGA
ncbi:MAG TPA: hypothetical protein VEH84_09410 [Alphaproteobacteria bacterium]|nr:hypothetical protein [Alphaproteobacteria bacterium]